VAGGERRSSASNGAAAAAAAAAALANGGGEGAGRGQNGGAWGAGWRPNRDKPVGRGASTTPAYGRHLAGVGWIKAGARALERGEGKTGRAASLGRMGGGSAQQRLPPFLFFSISFLQKA